MSISSIHSGNVFRALLIVFTCGLLAACSEDDVTTPPEEHFEAIGVYLSNSGIELASILRGVTDDTLFVPLDSSTDHIDVQFYDEDENIIDGPEDSDKQLAWIIGNTALCEVWQHAGEEGGYDVHLRGLAEGLTTIEFLINHEGHSDFRSGNIPVRVQAVAPTRRPAVSAAYEPAAAAQ